MITITNTSIKRINKVQKLNKYNYNNWLQVDFLQAVVESLENGILILNQAGKLVHANASACDICAQINPEYNAQKFLHPIIRQLWQSLIDNQSYSFNKLSILSDEIIVNSSNIFRIRVRWLNFNNAQKHYYLVIIENRYESLKKLAIAEIKKYNLTPREAELWSLYRGNYSYKDIAAKLYITINTVKKHMKNIHAKRQIFLEAQQQCSIPGTKFA